MGIQVRAHWLRYAAGLLVIAAAGCGSSEPRLPLYPASGKVVVGDRPAAGVEVRLYDAANPTNPDSPHPYATTDDAGEFQLSTFEAGDGAPVGRYSVMLLWPEGPPGPGTPKDRFGNAFTNPAQSPFSANLAEGGTRLEPFRVDPAMLQKAAAKAKARREPVNPAEPR